MKNLLRTPEPECGGSCEGEKTDVSDLILKRICAVKTIRKQLDPILTNINALDATRETALARTKIEEGMMWLGMELKRIGDENPTFVKNPYPDSKDPSTPAINPTAEGLKFGK